MKFERPFRMRHDAKDRLPEGYEKGQKSMSNKKTIKRPSEPIKKPTNKESNPTKSRKNLVSLLPAIIFIGFAIWYFISSLK
jgi:hypothetical protein